ncbi:hypothetical protein KIN20_001044 [Parelaphostrongylus tenuis]|uniref:Mon2/Sec7/BIG1-like HDS domain-containing protein n=1 Tax=Parelaphostrongylus tenuis TaxID=148309 RepID=A0AAD5QGN5_PARTN|nr:hypothetical protein KIN20_001044 [Parelaphostrongylus tenuis]
MLSSRSTPPECWKYVIRCSEYIWELEKFIYGALCYEKPSRFSFSRSKQPAQPPSNEEMQGETAADRSVENALGNGEVDRDSLNRALCILIAKADRFYTKVGHELNLRSLRELCMAVTSASENRIFYSGKKAAVLTPTTNLLTRISDILSSLGNRPLVHQMLVWPIVASSPDESRLGVMALSDTISSLMLPNPKVFASIKCLSLHFRILFARTRVRPRPVNKLFAVLADFVKTKSDRIGSGWKTLFGTLRAVRTSEVGDASVHWTVLDVIGTYLRIEKYSVLSWSLPDCLPCIVHFLQASQSKTESREEEAVDDPKRVDDQLSEAALRLVTPTFAVILNLFKTAHIANPNLLHRAAKRSKSLDEVEWVTTSFCPLSACLDPVQFPIQDGDPSPLQLDASLEVPLGDLPWTNLSPSEVASLELLLSLVEHLSGTLITAPSCVQPMLLVCIQQLITTSRLSEFGVTTACFCLSTLLLPHIQKWLRRNESKKVDNGRSDANLRQAVGISTQMVVDILSLEQTSWHSPLLLDICRLATECAIHSGDLPRVGAACLRHLTTLASHYTSEQWTILSKSLWDTTSATLAPIRLLLSVCPPDSADKKSDLGEIMVDGTEGLPLKQKILAKQVFLVDAQKERLPDENLHDESTNDLNLVFTVEEEKQRMSISYLISSLLAHQLIVQLIGTILCPCERVPEDLERILIASECTESYELSDDVRVMLHHCLDASFQVALDFQRLRSLSSALSQAMGITRPNLYKQLVSSALIKMYSLLIGAKKKSPTNLLRWRDCLNRMVSLLRNAEVEIASNKLATTAREHKEEKFEFMLVESDHQKLYKIVSEKEINSTILEYQRQRPIGLPSNAVNGRPNPFRPDLIEESKDENEPDYDTLCLLAYRQICLVPIRMVLSLDDVKDLLPQILDSVKKLILATPDITIRKLAVQIIDILTEN